MISFDENDDNINLSQEQKQKIEFAQKQYLTNAQAEKDIEECLKH